MVWPAGIGHTVGHSRGQVGCAVVSGGVAEEGYAGGTTGCRKEKEAGTPVGVRRDELVPL